ncbi:MAG TPA: serine hydrolase domain-containing protein [Thermoplasmata archaeon]|nr:serine hydrolase domain-containing protein [Thermoplasmata archaeon]
MAMREPAPLDLFASRLMRRFRIPGLSLGISRNGRPILSRGYGWRDRELRRPASSKTVYGIASITKSFTALAILRLEEEGLLRVTDPVVRHLPEFRSPNPRWTAKISLHHLLTHSSGMPPLAGTYLSQLRSRARDPSFDARSVRRVGIDLEAGPLDSFEQLLEYLTTVRYQPIAPPGHQFSYSNEGFMLLGAVIERSAGRTYENYLDEQILRPCGMRHTTCDAGIMLRYPEVTTLYSPQRIRSRVRMVPSQNCGMAGILRPAGGLLTNIEDLLRYLEIFRTGGRAGRERILTPKSVSKMLRPAIPIDTDRFYGYGIVVRPAYHGHLVAYHGGGTKGVSSEFAVVPRKGICGAVLANVERVPSFNVLFAGINRQLGLPMSTPFFETPSVVSRAGPLAEFEGWYWGGDGFKCNVRAGRRELTLRFWELDGNTHVVRAAPCGTDRFLIRLFGLPWTIRFVRDASKRVSAVFVSYWWYRRRTEQEVRHGRRNRFAW